MGVTHQPSDALMQRAIELARDSMRTGGGPFGAMVVDPSGAAVATVPQSHVEQTPQGWIVAIGQNRVVPHCDPTAHAEVVAIRQACAALERFSLSGLVLYTSCEPCPMCLAAIYWARLDAVYYAGTRDDAAHAGFDDSHFYDELAKPVATRSLPMQPLMREAARGVFEQWLNDSGRTPY